MSELKPLFGAPVVVQHIDMLKQRVAARDTKAMVKIENIYSDYSARMDAVEQTLQTQVDQHALETEAAISAELSNRGEQAIAAASNSGGAPATSADASASTELEAK